MNTEDLNKTAVNKLKKTHENFTVGIGVAIGIVFMSYFFSFAAFIDNVKPGLVTFQAITTILLVFCLIYLKKIALYFTRFKYRNSEPHSILLKQLSHTDFEKDAQGLNAIITARESEK